VTCSRHDWRIQASQHIFVVARIASLWIGNPYTYSLDFLPIS
jgi:hypothetical protein